MNLKSNKYFSNLLFPSVILFLLLYYLLSFHSRIAGDDFFYLGLKNKFGAWDGMMYQYMNWSGRWTAHFIGCGLLSFWKSEFFLPFINTLSLVMLFASLYKLSHLILKQINIDVDRKMISAVIIILISCFFFTSYSIGETWYWYIIIITYLWSIISFLFVLYSVLNYRSKILDILSIIIFSTFIGGASESYAIIFIFCLFALLIYNLFIQKIKINSTINLKIIFALTLLCISFTFSIIAPGTDIRHDQLPHTTLLERTFIAIKSYAKFFLYFLPKNLIYLLMFSSPWIYFGSISLKNKFSKVSVIKSIKSITLIFLLLIAATLVPTAFIMSETGPDRALSIVSFFTAVYFAVLFSLMGTFIDFDKMIFKRSALGISIIMVGILCYHICTQYSITEKFASAYDSRLQIIENAKVNNYKGILQLNKLPDNGMLFWEELSVDTDYFTNKHLREGLGLNFQVKLKTY